MTTIAQCRSVEGAGLLRLRLYLYLRIPNTDAVLCVVMLV